MLLPGAGHVYVGAWRRGLLFLWISGALVLILLLLAAARPSGMASSLVDRRVLAAFLFANLALLAFRLFAIVDAWRWGPERASRFAVLALAVIAAVTAAPHVAAAYVTVRGYGVLEAVFADEEPGDVLPANGIFLSSVRRPPAPRAPDQVWPGHQVPTTDPVVRNPAHESTKPLSGSRRVLVGTAPSARPWITILLLGSDAGPGQVGERTDTMIVVALQRGTGRAAAFGIPRNLVDVPLGGVAGRSLNRFAEPLNGLYGFARTKRELFPGGRDAGATALKQTVSRLLGIRVDYYALVDLAGFADIVDALGGVDIHVKERLVDEVTRPAWGEPKPTIDVHPGRTYHFFGREALAYVRSRKASNDYTRMARQRCFLSAIAQQLDVLKLLRHFGSLAATVEASVRTDIPLDRAPDLIRVTGAVDPRQTLTETFGPDYIARRRASDRFPVPDVAKIRTAVREMILLAPRLPKTPARSVHEAC
jgi:LCP family protein required for cell wall assembly